MTNQPDATGVAHCTPTERVVMATAYREWREGETTGLEDLVGHFQRNGIKADVAMSPLYTIDNPATVCLTLEKLRIRRRPRGGITLKTFAIRRCKDEAAAIRIYDGALRNRNVAGVTRNGVFVLECTFVPPDPKKATEIQEIFRNFKPVWPDRPERFG